jgi:hypothetical protein
MKDEYNYRTVGFDVFLNRGVPIDGETEDEISLRSPQISATSLVPGITKSQNGRMIVNWEEEQIIIKDGARNRVEIGKIPGTEEYGVRIYNSLGNVIFSAAGQLQTEGIADSAVGTTQIADAAITNAKIKSLAADKITTGTLDADRIAASSITTDKLSASYVEVGGAASDVNAGTTTISGGKITATSIEASKLNVSTLSAISADIGTITAGSVTGITITGSLFRTAASGQRIEINDNLYASTAALKFVHSGGNIAYFYMSGASEVSFIGSTATDLVLWSNLRLAARIDMLNNQLLRWKDTDGNFDGFIKLDSNNNFIISLTSAGDIGIDTDNKINLDADDGVFINGSQKTAIVPTSQGYRALYCMESPEVWFMDFCESKKKIDPLFLEVTEGEMKFIKVEGGGYQVWRRRKGHAGFRFEEKTQREYDKNNLFWAGQRP